ncbi:partner of Y14 and mago [Armigeres subalbatus]|uniref:partner of Y14 and mago n=1 Tax=Armigeres subalbatus TaxID=124917 RepID=UPI002ED51DF4
MTTYATDSQGKFIPSTQRPDGTWRKPRRVRDGYVPQEEVPLYESKGKLFAQKPSLPPGMSPEIAQKSKEKREKEQRIRAQREAEANRRPPQNPVPGLLILNGDSKINHPQQRTAKPTKPKKKAIELPDVLLEQKQKEDQKQARQQQKPLKDHKNTKPQQQHIEDVATALNGLQLTNSHAADALQTDLSKKLRKLRKKIREIEIIEERLQSNDGGPRPDKDQIDKAKRKPEILKEIEELEKSIVK